VILEPIALYFDFDDGGVVKKAIEDGGGCRNITDEFSPVL